MVVVVVVALYEKTNNGWSQGEQREWRAHRAVRMQAPEPRASASVAFAWTLGRGRERSGWMDRTCTSRMRHGATVIGERRTTGNFTAPRCIGALGRRIAINTHCRATLLFWLFISFFFCLATSCHHPDNYKIRVVSTSAGLGTRQKIHLRLRLTVRYRRFFRYLTPVDPEA